VKKLTLLSVIAFLTFLPLRLQAQSAASDSCHDSETRKSSKKAASLSGEVGGDGKTLTADRDRRVWEISNPEILSRIDARHVRVRVQVDATHGQIRILSVSAIVDEHAGIRFDDAAFRR
jgi:hypothetical protein